MAVFTEAAVKVAIELRRDPTNGDRVIVSAYSIASDGTPIRSESQFDVTTLVSAARQAEVTDLLNAAEAFFKSRWQIP